MASSPRSRSPARGSSLDHGVTAQRLVRSKPSHLPIFVGWIEKWIQAADAGQIDLLFTTFEMMVQDPSTFFGKLAAYCDLEQAHINVPHPRSDPLFQFRGGRADEWREQFTPAQQERVYDAVPVVLLKRFGWA